MSQYFNASLVCWMIALKRLSRRGHKRLTTMVVEEKFFRFTGQVNTLELLGTNLCEFKVCSEFAGGDACDLNVGGTAVGLGWDKLKRWSFTCDAIGNRRIVASTVAPMVETSHKMVKKTVINQLPPQ